MKKQIKTKPEEAVRYNNDKVPYSMLPPECLEAINTVFQMGAKKYSRDNWRRGRGLSYNETYDSLMRHLEAWRRREVEDKESGLPHTAHVAWNAIALLYFELTGTGEDDRYTGAKDALHKKE